MKNRYDVVFLPLHREIGKIIASEVYWAVNTFRTISKVFRIEAFVGNLSENGRNHLEESSGVIVSYGMNSERTIFNDFLFYFLILKSGLKKIFSAQILHHYGSFGYLQGFNPSFFLPKLGKKYVIGPILYPTNDPPDTALKLGFIKKTHQYGKLMRKLFCVFHTLTLSRADVIIFDTVATRQIYLRKYKLLLNKKIYIIPGGGIDPVEFYSATLDLSHKENVILGIASNLIKRKNIDKIICAMNSVGSKVKLRIAGEGPEMETLISLVRQLSLTDRVDFCGRIDHNSIREFYNSIDVYVALDNAPTEAKISVQEAMMCGCTIISGESEVPNGFDLRDWGIIVNPTDVDKVALALGKICHDFQLLNVMRYDALKYAQIHFSSNSVLKELKNVYDKLLTQ